MCNLPDRRSPTVPDETLMRARQEKEQKHKQEIDPVYAVHVPSLWHLLALLGLTWEPLDEPVVQLPDSLEFCAALPNPSA